MRAVIPTSPYIPVMVTHLLIHLCLGGPRAQVPAASTLIIALVLDRDFAEMANDVLHLGIASAAALAAQVIEPRDLVHQVVHNGNDNL